ncbi:MAG: ribokinase [Hyphomicrobiaceae bacterium]
MITVFGSINVDVTFQLQHLPALGETVLTPEFSHTVGGKGANQAVSAKRYGAQTAFIGCVGDDAFGVTAKTALTNEGIVIDNLSKVTGNTGLASIYVDDNGDNMIAVASGANGKVTASLLPEQALGTDTLLVLQMEIAAQEVEAAIAVAKRRGARVLLNMAPAIPVSQTALSQIDILVLNEHEALSLCQTLSLATETAEVQLRGLSDALAATVVITLGGDGVIAWEDGQLRRAQALPITPVDTTGAGDCFVGVLAAGLDAGLPFGDALTRAAAAGSLACTVVGTLPSFPTLAQIEAAMR